MSSQTEFHLKHKSSAIQVQILSQNLVKPSFPTPKHLQNYNLSFFDLLARQAHIPCLRFFPSSESTFQKHEINNHLQTSLSKILTHFYPLAGRLNEDGLSIDCHDQGAKYIEAKVNCTLNEFFNEAYEKRELLKHFLPCKILEEAEVPLLAIQVTFFEYGGLVLAIYISHVPADGYSSFSLVNLWAKMSCSLFEKTNEHENYSIYCNAASLFPPMHNLTNILKPSVSKSPMARIVKKQLLFSSESISKLKEKVKENAQESRIKHRLSRVVIVTAIIWKALINAAKSRNGYLRPFVLSFSVGLRGKSAILDASKDYLGNLYLLVPIRFDPMENSLELHELVFLISDKLEKVSGDCGEASSSKLIEMEIEFRNEMREAGGSDEVDCIQCTSWCRFPMYETDFGFGKPCWVAAPGVPIQIVCLMDSKCGTGIEVQVSLNEVDMLVFERDADILELASVPKL